jgi:hypothetical protein
MDIQAIYKSIVIILLIVVILSLTSGLHFLMKDVDQSKKMVTSLTIRVTLSIILFLMIIIGFKLGLIHPNHM